VAASTASIAALSVLVPPTIPFFSSVNEITTGNSAATAALVMPMASSAEFSSTQ
jgi:hypothetical protein